VTVQKLLKQFGSSEMVRAATEDQLAVWPDAPQPGACARITATCEPSAQ